MVRRKAHILPTIALLIVYMISYIGIGVHECKAEGSKEFISLLGCECAHPHNEHHDEDCHHDGACHHDGDCCHTVIYSIAEADNGGGSDALHNYAPDFTAILIHNIYDLNPIEFNLNQDINYSIPITFNIDKRVTVLRI